MSEEPLISFKNTNYHKSSFQLDGIPTHKFNERIVLQRAYSSNNTRLVEGKYVA